MLAQNDDATEPVSLLSDRSTAPRVRMKLGIEPNRSSEPVRAQVQMLESHKERNVGWNRSEHRAADEV